MEQNRKILLLRPKLYMANDGNYREERYFTAWGINKYVAGELESLLLPSGIRNATGQRECPFGVAAL